MLGSPLSSVEKIVNFKRSPYAPPRAEVRDLERGGLPLQKPKQIALAVTLLWLSLVLGAVASLLDLRYVQSTAPGLAKWIIPLTVLGMLALLAVLISSGHNWARIVFLVIFLMGALPYLFTLPNIFSRSLVAGSASAAQVILQAVAICLVFSRPASGWFRRVK